MAPVAAQTSQDTIYGRCYRYFYDNWYDQCVRYHDCTSEITDRNWFFESPVQSIILHFGVMYDMVARRYTVPRRVAIKGLVALAHGQRKPEYMMIYQYDTTALGNAAFLGMTRWDTAERKVMKLPQCTQTMNMGDPSKFLYLDAYEAYLDKPVVVDSVFFIAGTYNSDTLRVLPSGDSIRRQNIYYSSIRTRDGYEKCEPCLKEGTIYYNFFPVTGEWHEVHTASSCGMFLAIVDSDYYQLTVVSDSVPMGTTTGSGHYVSMSQVQISATPNDGYRFAMWSDGSTENPRTVEVYYDTVFTAIFTDETNYVVSVAANQPSRGAVSGGGIYAPGQTALLQATVTDDSCHFAGWSDGDTNNPRAVVVDRDSLFTALFAMPMGIGDAGHAGADFALSPNPAREQLTLTTTQDGLYSVEVFDNNGRRVAATTFSGHSWTLDVSNLANGSYFVHLHSLNGSGTKTFVRQ